MNRMQQWWKTESEKLRGRSWKERTEYLWRYYKLWIIAILCAMLFLPTGIYHYATTNAEDWFFACFANTNVKLGAGSDFYEGFAEYAGYDLSEKNLTVSDQCFVNPKRKLAGNQYYQLLVTYLDSGILDTLVMEPEYLQMIGASGRLMDLRDQRTQSIFEQYHDRIIYCVPVEEKNGTEPIPIGIDLTGSILTDREQAYPLGAALGVSANVPHPEEIEIFLSYLFDSQQETEGDS